MPSVFISYSRVDTAFVRRLHDALKAAQYDIWVDWEDIPPSATWTDEIRAGVTGADAFVYVISPDSVASEVCGHELDWALERNKRIVPVVHREPDGAKVPEAAAALNWVFLRDGDDFDAGVATLTVAVETDLDHVRTHTRLGVAAGRWNQSGRDRSQLLRGQELAAAEAWLVGGAGLKPEPTQLQREYVLASRQSATRRQRTLIGAVTFGLAVAIVLAVVALIQRSSAIHERNVAQAGLLDSRAQNAYTTDPERSVVLAVKAAQITPGSVTEAALREAIAKSPIRERYDLDQATPTAGDAVWNPDGTRLLVTSPQQWARIYQPGSGASPVTLAGTTSSAGQSAWDTRGNLVVLGGHNTAVYNAQTGALVQRLPVASVSVALTPDGSQAVTVDENGTGRVFDVATGQLLATFHPGYSGGVTCFALSPNGAVAAQCDEQSGSNPNTQAALDTWDVATGRPLRSVPSASEIASVAFNPNGTQYVFTNTGPARSSAPANSKAFQDAAIQGQETPSTFVYSTATGRLVVEFPGGAATAAAFSPSLQDPEVAYALLEGPALHVYNFLSHKNTLLIGPTDTVDSISFSHNGIYLVEGSRDTDARVYNAITGGPAVELLAGASGTITSASFGNDDTLIATTSQDGFTRVWASPLPRPSLTVPGIGIPTASVGFGGGGRFILNTSQSGQGELLDASDLRVLSRFTARSGNGFVGAAISSNGRYIYAVTGPVDPSTGRTEGTSVETFDASTGHLVATMPGTPAGPIIASADIAGDRLVTIGGDGVASEWDPRTGKLLHTLSASTGIPGGVVFSKDGSQIAILHYPPLPAKVTYKTTFGPVKIDLWSASTGRLERTITGDPLQTQVAGLAIYPPLAAAFSPDGGTLAVAGGQPYISLYDIRTGMWLPKALETTGTVLGNFVVSVAYSPNGSLLAAGAAAGTFVWRVPSYLPIAPLQQVPAGSVSSLVGDGAGVEVGFTSDSSTLITTSTGDLDTVEAWNPNLQLQLEYLQDTRGTLNPAGTEFVGVNNLGVSLYPCELCGSLTHLMDVARAHITLSPELQADVIKQAEGG